MRVCVCMFGYVCICMRPCVRFVSFRGYWVVRGIVSSMLEPFLFVFMLPFHLYFTSFFVFGEHEFGSPILYLNQNLEKRQFDFHIVILTMYFFLYYYY